MDVGQISATPKQIAKSEMTRAIVDNIINVAECVSKHAARMPKYKLPRIATAARKRRKDSIAMMLMSMYVGAARQSAIISRPIPKTEIFNPSGVAAIGDTGEELQIK